LTDEIEFDEVYLVAGHKGRPDKVKAKGREARRRRLKGCRGRGTLAKEKPPILGMVQRSGEVILKMLPNVQQATIHPVIAASVAQGALVSPTNTTSTTGWLNGAITIKRSIIVSVNMLVMKTAMDFMKSMSIPLKASGHC
jgi:hypothetical protein